MMLAASVSTAGIVGNAKPITAIHAQGHDITAVWGNAKLVWSSEAPAWSPLDLSPYAWYQGNDNATDSSGNGWDATWSAGAAYTAGVNGNCLNFTNNAYLTCSGTKANLNITNGFTVCTWIYLVHSPYLNRAITLCSQWGAGGVGNASFYVRLEPANYMSFISYRTSIVTVQTPTISLNGWIHLAYVYEGGTGAANTKCYRNGSLVAERQMTQVPQISTAYDLLIGNRSGADFINAPLDDFMIYERPLTVDEIGQIYNWRQ